MVGFFTPGLEQGKGFQMQNLGSFSPLPSVSFSFGHSWLDLLITPGWDNVRIWGFCIWVSGLFLGWIFYPRKSFPNGTFPKLGKSFPRLFPFFLCLIFLWAFLAGFFLPCVPPDLSWAQIPDQEFTARRFLKGQEYPKGQKSSLKRTQH